MGLYKLVISKQVRKKDVPKIPSKYRPSIIAAMESLRKDPRLPQAKKLTNREEYRLRQGDYRILYVIADEVRIVEVRRVKHRHEAIHLNEQGDAVIEASINIEDLRKKAWQSLRDRGLSDDQIREIGKGYKNGDGFAAAVKEKYGQR